MADETEAQTGEEGVDVPGITDEAFQEVLTGDVPEGEAEEEKPEDKKPDPNEAKLSQISGQLQRQSDALLALQTENAYLRTRVSQPQRETAEKAEKPARPGLPDAASINEQIRKDPGATIASLLGNIKESILGEVADLVAGTTQQTKQELSQATELERIRNDDRSRTMTEYGPLMKNKAFLGEATKIYEEMTSGRDYVPDAMFIAAERAYARCVRNGSIRSATITPIGERARAPKIQNPFASGSREGSNEGDNGMSVRELAAIDKVCKEFGITREKYFKQVAGLQKRDPSFGRGGN